MKGNGDSTNSPSYQLIFRAHETGGEKTQEKSAREAGNSRAH